MSKPRTDGALPLSWGTIKKMVEARGVRDDDLVYLMDLGPNAQELHVSVERLRDYLGDRRTLPMRALRAVEIADDPAILRADVPDPD